MLSVNDRYSVGLPVAVNHDMLCKDVVVRGELTCLYPVDNPSHPRIENKGAQKNHLSVQEVANIVRVKARC